ncbi:MAG: hypothetical protein K6B67_07865 [Lachnospiraceae bacterium]|nr:hypothetical protein [Lachnospiraceae bacterium]
MQETDFDYLAEQISRLSYIPIRHYKNKELISFYDPAGFPIDPAGPYIDMLLNTDEEILYYISHHDHFYGLLSFGESTLILGPTLQTEPSRDKIKDFMFEMGIESGYFEQYQALFHRIFPIPLETFFTRALPYLLLHHTRQVSN